MRNNLTALPKSERNEIIREVQGHIEDHLLQSQSNSAIHAVREVLNQLGDPVEYANQIVAINYGELVEKGDWKAHSQSFFKEMSLPFGLAVLIEFILMMANTLGLHRETLFLSNTSLGDTLTVLLLSIPAIIVIIIPTASSISIGVVFARFLNLKENPQILHSPKLWIQVTLVGLCATILTFSINEIVVPFSNHQTVKTVRQILEKNNMELLPYKQSPREISSWKLYSALEKGQYKDKELEARKDLHYKFSLPLMGLLFAFIGAFSGIIAATNFFNHLLLYIIFAGVGPVILFYLFFMTSASAWLPVYVFGGFDIALLFTLFTAKPYTTLDY